MTGNPIQTIIIAMAALRQGDTYLLQLRNGDPAIGAVGLIGFYGGKIKAGEPVIRAVCREIGEETTLVLDPSLGREAGTVIVDSDMKGRAIRVQAHVIEFEVEKELAVESREGELVRMTEEELRQYSARLTPATLEYFKSIKPIL